MSDYPTSQAHRQFSSYPLLVMRAAVGGSRPAFGWKGEAHVHNSRLNLFLLMPLLCTPQISARQNHSAARPGDRIYLDVVVSPTSGPPVSGLGQQDFTVLDHNVPQTITSFQAVDGRQDTLPHKPSTASAAPADTSDPSYYANVRPYVDLPMAELVERIPELKTLQPAPDQQELPMILQKMGQSMDDFVRDIGDLIAHEDVTQQQLTAREKVKAKEQVKDNYLILPHGYEWGASAEYRMDDKGNRLGAIGLEQGYLVTSGYALSCISFSTVAQSQSRFRYLGEQKMDSRETYVLAFAQLPGEATFTTLMKGTGAKEVDMLTQGILWVDKNGFQIIHMRSDLLAPNTEIRLDQLTTDVTFSAVQLQDVPNPLWLPSEVDVYIEIRDQKFRNVHHYTNYRRYRVSAKMKSPQ